MSQRPLVALLRVADKIRTLIAMVFHTLLALLLIRLDALVSLPICAFPRSPAQAARSWWLQKSVRKLEGAGNLQMGPRTTTLEPAKAASRAPLVYVNATTGDVLARLFIKCGDAFSRGLPLWLTALASFSGNREVYFYQHIRRLLPSSVDAPRAVLAAEVALLARWCLVLTDVSTTGSATEYSREPTVETTKAARRSRSPERRGAGAHAGALHAYVVPDRTGCSLAMSLAVVRTLARLHAAFWGAADREPALRPLTKHRAAHGPRGYVPAPAVAILLGRSLPKLPRLKRLWTLLLSSRLGEATTTLLHGDCRPENLMFHCRGGPAAADALPEAAGGAGGWRVTLLDWEAVGVNPAANDLVYFIVIGLRARDAALWEDTLLEAYHSELMAAGAHIDCTIEQLRAEFRLVGCVLLVVQACFAVEDIFKGWGNHGANLLPWMVRLCQFTRRLDVKAVSALLPAEQRGEVREILNHLKEKASAGLARLEKENGAELVASL